MASTENPPRLLKAEAVRQLGAKVAFNFEDVRRRCDEHLERVRQQARQMIEQAAAEAEVLKSQAAADGRAHGFEQGMQQADEEIQRRADRMARDVAEGRLKTTLPAMQQAAEALMRERDRWLADWEASAVRLCVAIAERLVRHELHVRPQRCRDTLRAALELATGTSSVRLRMNPDDLQGLGDDPERYVRDLATCGGVTLIADPDVSPGGCLLETSQGQIDARLETQLERITAELLGDDAAEDRERAHG